MVIGTIGTMKSGATLIFKYALEDKENSPARLIVESFVDTFNSLADDTIKKLKDLHGKQVILKKDG